ncbi:hypothetical protein BFJ63_vAg18053 [Fusarium oxysporum f. sp. narcissi]|uniref:Uncharacterized protein n=1 Tax=Fusarium oxysporum f. sp. narcissi TaxID=451672 RepID=A0A4Q2V335_FUSOX|nr:hypothetical protein BFJ63_vAg18053 [Fusarium oxysporum f. sp. narcissi]
MPVVNMDAVNFFKPPTAWTLNHSPSRILHGNTKSEDLLSAQTSQQRETDYHSGFSTSPSDRDEAEDEFPPADQLRLGSSCPDITMDLAGLRPSTSRVPATLATSQDYQSTPDNPIIIEDDTDDSDDDDNDGSSTSAITMSHSTTSGELTTTSADVPKDNMDSRIPALSDLRMTLSSPTGQVLSEQFAPPDEDCPEEPQDDVGTVNRAQSLLSSPSRLGEPSSAPTEISQCAIEEGFRTESLPGEQDLSTGGRDEALATPKNCQVFSVSVNSIDSVNSVNSVNSVETETPQEKDRSTNSSHTSDEDESEDEIPRPPVKRRRTRQGSTITVCTSPARSCSSPRFRLRRLHNRRQSPQSRGSYCGTSPADNRPIFEPQCRPRPVIAEHDAASVPFVDACRDLEQATHAEFKEFSFQGVAKCITLGNERIFHLEFSLPGGFGDVSLPMSSIDYGTPKSGSRPNRRRRLSKRSRPGSRSPGDK